MAAPHCLIELYAIVPSDENFTYISDQSPINCEAATGILLSQQFDATKNSVDR